MNKKEEFKNFLRKNMHLASYVNEGKTTYQKLFETYDLYGENSEVWDEYGSVKKNKNESIGIKSILNNLKNIDIDKLEENIGSLEKALGFLEEIMSSRSEKQEMKKNIKKTNSEIERFFDD